MTVPPSVAGVREGDLLAGKYRVDRVLGAGGMGVVVAAHHVHLDERVAIKFLLPEMLGNTEAVARFSREARAAVKIKSEHVARVSDVGTLDNGAPYMVMEYLDGGDLAAWLKQRGALPIEQAVDFVLQTCEAIAEAHSLGIIHRDLKPANLFVIRRPDGALSVKVLDFGISKMGDAGLSASDASITKTSAGMGSPLYMSPEQMQSAKDVDTRTDIWALGVILHELVTGDSPFMADSFPELVARIISSPPPPIRSKRPDAPEGLDAVTQRCLEKDRNRRYATVAQFAADLMPFAPRRARLSFERIAGIMGSSGLSGSTLALPAGMEPELSLHSQRGESRIDTVGTFGHTLPSEPKRHLLALTLGALLVFAGASFGLYAMLKSDASKASATPPSVPSAPELASGSTLKALASAPLVEDKGHEAAPPLAVVTPPEAPSTQQADVKPVKPSAAPPAAARNKSAPPKSVKAKASEANTDDSLGGQY